MFAIIFDVDGTLADASGRLGLIPDWDRFFSHHEMNQDLPIHPICKIAAEAYKEYDVIFNTGRPLRTSLVTTYWLEKYVGAAHNLFFRGDDDRRPSHEVKADNFRRILDLGFDPIVAFEDRAADADVYRRYGLIVHQIGEGNF